MDKSHTTIKHSQKGLTLNAKSKAQPHFQTWIEISKANLKEAYTNFQKRLGPIAPVLKSNAYGHGVEHVYGALKEVDIENICVFNSTEAIELRKLGYEKRLIVLGIADAHLLSTLCDLNVEILVPTWNVLKMWLASAKKPNIHLKFDTGLSRLGFHLNDCNELFTKIKPEINRVVGLSTHFANVEEVPEGNFAKVQLKRLLEVKALFLEHFPGKKILVHSAASAAAMLLEETRLDMCRVGIATYGLWPSAESKQLLQRHDPDFDLKPALSWYSRLVQVQRISKGTKVGYGCRFRAPQEMTIGVIPVGYYEGYPRIATVNPCYVLVRGKICRILGTICMNMMIIDLDAVDNPQVDDKVTLIGRDGNEEVSADLIATWCGTINYEIVSRLLPSLPRILV